MQFKDCNATEQYIHELPCIGGCRPKTVHLKNQEQLFWALQNIDGHASENEVGRLEPKPLLFHKLFWVLVQSLHFLVKQERTSFTQNIEVARISVE